jgi:hypothetical protein
MKVLKRTPRTDLMLDGILIRMSELLSPVAEELGVPTFKADEALTTFARLSARVAFDTGEIDFSPVEPGDGADQIHAKFNVYLDTECMETVIKALAAVSESDRPAEPMSAPAPPEGAKGN